MKLERMNFMPKDLERLPGGVWLGVGLDVGEENREGTLREKAVVGHSLGTEHCWWSVGEKWAG